MFLDNQVLVKWYCSIKVEVWQIMQYIITCDNVFESGIVIFSCNLGFFGEYNNNIVSVLSTDYSPILIIFCYLNVYGK